MSVVMEDRYFTDGATVGRSQSPAVEQAVRGFSNWPHSGIDSPRQLWQSGGMTSDEGDSRHEFRIKCVPCGLHYVVLTWNEDWPNTHACLNGYCPECGQTSEKLVWHTQLDEPICHRVPGDAKPYRLPPGVREIAPEDLDPDNLEEPKEPV